MNQIRFLLEVLAEVPPCLCGSFTKYGLTPWFFIVYHWGEYFGLFLLLILSVFKIKVFFPGVFAITSCLLVLKTQRNPLARWEDKANNQANIKANFFQRRYAVAVVQLLSNV